MCRISSPPLYIWGHCGRMNVSAINSPCMETVRMTPLTLLSSYLLIHHILPPLYNPYPNELPKKEKGPKEPSFEYMNIKLMTF